MIDSDVSKGRDGSRWMSTRIDLSSGRRARAGAYHGFSATPRDYV